MVKLFKKDFLTEKGKLVEIILENKSGEFQFAIIVQKKFLGKVTFFSDEIFYDNDIILPNIDSVEKIEKINSELIALQKSIEKAFGK